MDDTGHFDADAPDYFKLLRSSGALSLPSEQTPLSLHDWESAMDEQGRLTDPESIKERVSKAGMEEALRPILWKYFLGYYPWDSTLEERKKLEEKQKERYTRLKTHWSSISNAQLSSFSEWRSQQSQIEKDVVRTDRDLEWFQDDQSPYLLQLNNILCSYAWFNWDLGYVQGMNDILAILIPLFGEEHVSFWCFAGKMKRMLDLFENNQPGVQRLLTLLVDLIKRVDPLFYSYLRSVNGTHMFFCFRWFLLYFKREFTVEQTQRVWEMIWAHPDPDYVLWIALAIMLIHRDTIISNKMCFEDILRYMSSLSNQLDHSEVIQLSQELYHYFHVAGGNYDSAIEEYNRKLSENKDKGQENKKLSESKEEIKEEGKEEKKDERQEKILESQVEEPKKEEATEEETKLESTDTK
eukprot:TRINITY_DN4267_c0_g1_i1.p1 TRINITY_DN4267_c0_g1~~TRINITY_DN4267_c0_g1_i1.p1  ORF type:complete len:410 (-),score=94.28 TRINITY_DN4267_c0_g1_i1:66-1295(-)